MTVTPGSGGPTAVPDASARRVFVLRFSRTERLVHWVHAAAFTALLGSGLMLYLPGLTGALGSREAIKTAHLYLAAAWVVALLLIVALGDRSGLRATARELDRFDVDDRRWLRGAPAPQGRLNAGQKLHAVVQAAFAVLFLISGGLLFYGERNTLFRLDGTLVLHDALTVAGTILVAAHVYLAVLHPPTRPALRGIVTGSVRQEWADRHHSSWAPQPSGPLQPSPLRRPGTWVLILAAVAVVALTAALVPVSPLLP